jgi:hypothetical protein
LEWVATKLVHENPHRREADPIPIQGRLQSVAFSMDGLRYAFATGFANREIVTC